MGIVGRTFQDLIDLKVKIEYIVIQEGPHSQDVLGSLSSNRSQDRVYVVYFAYAYHIFLRRERGVDDWTSLRW